MLERNIRKLLIVPSAISEYLYSTMIIYIHKYRGLKKMSFKLKEKLKAFAHKQDTAAADMGKMLDVLIFSLVAIIVGLVLYNVAAQQGMDILSNTNLTSNKYIGSYTTGLVPVVILIFLIVLIVVVVGALKSRKD